MRGRERHGWRDRAYRDVFTASPAIGPTPPTHRKSAFDVASAFAVAPAGAGLQALPSNTPSCTMGPIPPGHRP
ncbi:conserved hypothetical protein [Stenotrophomonas thermophila]|nr:conserved hypothetical protein [Stenotrophomonas maltophilia]